MNGFKEIGIKVDTTHKQFMLRKSNLIPFSYLEPSQRWLNEDRFTKAREARIGKLGAKAKKLMDAIGEDRYSFSDIMIEVYGKDLIEDRMITEPRTGKVATPADQDESVDFTVEWSQDIFWQWLAAFHKGAFLAKQQIRDNRQRFGSNPHKVNSIEPILIRCMAKFYRGIIVSEPTRSKNAPGTTKFSILVNHVFSQLYIGFSDDSIEKAIERALKADI